MQVIWKKCQNKIHKFTGSGKRNEKTGPISKGNSPLTRKHNDACIDCKKITARENWVIKG